MFCQLFLSNNLQQDLLFYPEAGALVKKGRDWMTDTVDLSLIKGALPLWSYDHSQTDRVLSVASCDIQNYPPSCPPQRAWFTCQSMHCGNAGFATNNKFLSKNLPILFNQV